MTNHLWILGFSKIWVKIEIWWWPAGGRWQRWQRSRVQSRKLSTNGARQPQKKSADFSGACTFHTNVHFCSKIHNICTCVGERGITIFGFFSSKKSALVLSMASLKGIFWDHFPIDELMSVWSSMRNLSVSMEMKATHLPPMQAWLVFKVQKRRTNLLILWLSSMIIYHR